MEDFLIHKETKTVIHANDRRTLHYSYEDFVEKVVKGDACFICGALPDTKPFNNEHVIPNWILKQYGTPASFMVLPNGTPIKNIHYTVPCCQECNTELGLKLEIPISNLLKQPFAAVDAALQEDESLYLKLFHWMCSLYFKTHLKDTFLPMERDRRKNSGKIADTYCWHPLYHIHTIVRQHHTNVKLSRAVQGTVLVFEALVETPEEEFDYLDNWNSQVMMVKVGRIVIFSVLDDSRFCLALYRTFLSRISGALNSVQIREVFARLRYANMNLKRRPRFYSLFSEKGFEIKARVPNKIELLKPEKEKVSLFELMAFYIGELMPESLPDREVLIKAIEDGHAEYIFDEHYQFFQHQSYNERKGLV